MPIRRGFGGGTGIFEDLVLHVVSGSALWSTTLYFPISKTTFVAAVLATEEEEVEEDMTVMSIKLFFFRFFLQAT